MTDQHLADVWRQESPYVLGALVHKFGDFDSCEDAAQDALMAATATWPRDGVPSDPRAWLIRTASRRLIDNWRSDQARGDREQRVAGLDPALIQPTYDLAALAPHRDDSLHMLLLCCHPVLARQSQVALTLRAVGGLTTEQIASAFLVPVSTMAQRISRAKKTLRSAGARFRDVRPDDLPDRVAAARQVLYLIFNEGYTSSGGDQLIDVSLTREAVRLARDLHTRLPSDHETTGLLALMLLTDARTSARTNNQSDLIALADQDRRRWDQKLIAEGVRILEGVLPSGSVGPFQLQAAIAAVHDEAANYAETDWPQISELYRMLEQIQPSATVAMNRAVAVGMTDGPAAGLALIEPLLADRAMRHNHRLHAVYAHLLEMAGRTREAEQEYSDAARLTMSLPEQRYLNSRAAQLQDGH